MRKTVSRFLCLCLLLTNSVCFIQAQSGRVRTSNKKSGSVKTQQTSNGAKADENSNDDVDAKKKTPILVLNARKRRAVDLSLNNDQLVWKIVKRLEQNDNLDVSYNPFYTKLEDAQEYIRKGNKSFVMLLRFYENYIKPTSGTDCTKEWTTECANEYKLEYTLLSPENGQVIKKGSVQTFFSLKADTKPLFQLFGYNCVNTSRYELGSLAVDCMTKFLLSQLNIH